MPRSSLPHPAAPDPSPALVVRKTKAVRVWVKSHPQSTRTNRLIRSMGVTMGLAGAGLLVGLCLWTSILAIVDPNPPQWLAKRLPYLFSDWGYEPPQLLQDIKAELRAQDRDAGNLISLKTPGTDKQLENLRLLPVFATRSPCIRDCKSLVELRLYERHHHDKQGLFLKHLDQLTIQGPPEKQIIDPAWQPAVGVVGSVHPLPLFDIKILQEKDLPGMWLNLTGRWKHQGSPVLYGQILHIDLQTLRINSLLNWHSASGHLPTWQNLDSVGSPELIVNQSVGLEPRLKIYTLVNTTATVATRLEEIALKPLLLAQVEGKLHYSNALLLAENRLWSAARQQLTQVQTQLAVAQWTPALEQQLQLITLHADISQEQAQRNWSRPSQTLLALLLDGQWEAALQLLKTADNGLEKATLTVLQRNSVRLWQRLTASFQVNSNQAATHVWGALILLAKEDEAAAMRWLFQNSNATAIQEFGVIATKIQPELPDANPAVAQAVQREAPNTNTAVAEEVQPVISDEDTPVLQVNVDQPELPNTNPAAVEEVQPELPDTNTPITEVSQPEASNGGQRTQPEPPADSTAIIEVSQPPSANENISSTEATQTD